MPVTQLANGQDRHYEIGNKLVDVFRGFLSTQFASDDVRLEDFPFTEQPAYGIAISPLGENEGLGTAGLDDIHYIFQAVRVLHGLGSAGLQSRSEWRNLARANLHRKRIGISGCELLTRVDFGSIAIPKEWSTWNLDSSVLKIIVMMRESR